MIAENAASGGGQGFAEKSDQHAEYKLIAQLGDCISHAEGPAAAMRMLEQQRILSDRIRFRQWLESQNRVNVSTPGFPERRANPAHRNLQRRAVWTLMQ